MAEHLGLEDVAVRALIARGPVRGSEGIADLQEAIRRGLAAHLPDTARAYNNLASMLYERGDVERTRETWREGVKVAERFGNNNARRFMVSQMTSLDYDGGRWDDALATSQAFIEECRREPHYNEHAAHDISTRILLARDGVAEAESELARTLELARATGDAQAVQPSLAVKLLFEMELGRRDAALTTARELLARMEETGLDLGLFQLARHAASLGLQDELRPVMEELDDVPQARVLRAIDAGELERAADLAGELGLRANEAELRLDAAAQLASAGRRADADRNLASALAFYREAGAPRYVRKAEALLAKTA